MKEGREGGREGGCGLGVVHGFRNMPMAWLCRQAQSHVGWGTSEAKARGLQMGDGGRRGEEEEEEGVVCWTPRPEALIGGSRDQSKEMSWASALPGGPWTGCCCGGGCC